MVSVSNPRTHTYFEEACQNLASKNIKKVELWFGGIYTMLIGFLSDQTYTNKKKIERNEEPNTILEKK